MLRTAFCTAPNSPPPPTATGGPRHVGARRFVARLVAALGLSAVLVAGGTGCASDQKVIEQANTFHGELSKAVITEPQMATYIQSVGDRIVDSAHSLYDQGYRPKKKTKEDDAWMFSKGMEFHFVNSKTLNAFTTGGEHMYVYTELLRRCKNEPELAAVMAHEYGHVFGRHVQNGMNRQMLSMVGAGGLAAAGYVAGGSENGEAYAGYGAGAGAAIAGLANAGFTRGDESEADHLGFDFYVRAGYAPDDFGGFFRTILEEEKKAGGGAAAGGLAAFTSDHPATADRIANSEKWAADWKAKHPDWQTRVKAPVADTGKFAQIQQESVALAKTMPDDASLSNQKLLAALPRSCMFPDEPAPPDAKAAQQQLAQIADQREAAAAAKQPKAKKKPKPSGDGS